MQDWNEEDQKVDWKRSGCLYLKSIYKKIFVIFQTDGQSGEKDSGKQEGEATP